MRINLLNFSPTVCPGFSLSLPARRVPFLQCAGGVSPVLLGRLQVLTQHVEEVCPLLALSVPALEQGVQGLHLRPLPLQLTLQTAHLRPQLDTHTHTHRSGITQIKPTVYIRHNTQNGDMFTSSTPRLRDGKTYAN